MASLSVRRQDGREGFGWAANPIFVTAPIEQVPNGGVWTFELLEKDADFMLRHLGQRLFFCLDGIHTFFGEIRSVEHTAPAHPTLQAMPDRPAMRVTMIVHHDPDHKAA